MLRSTIVRRGLMLLGLPAIAGILTAGSVGCLKIGGDEPLVRVNAPPPEPAPVDTSRVPQVRTVEEGQQRLNEAYQRISYLEQELARSQNSNAKLKADVKNAKQERDRYKDRLEKYEGD